MNRVEFVKKFGDAIVASTKGTPLFPSVMMAQAIIETSNSQGLPYSTILAKEHNNFFGIKADTSWLGKRVQLPTREVINGKSVMKNEWFRSYDTVLQSLSDRNRFLMVNPRYTTSGVFAAKTPQEQADALQRAGYATDPNYAATIKSIIRSLKLEDLDAQKNNSSETPLVAVALLATLLLV